MSTNIIAFLRKESNIFELKAGQCYIVGNNAGLNDSNYIYFDNMTLDIKHAAIDLRQSKINILDFFSKCGTFVDSVKLTPVNFYELNTSCSLKFGSLVTQLDIISSDNENMVESIEDDNEIILCTPEREFPNRMFGRNRNEQWLTKLDRFPALRFFQTPTSPTLDEYFHKINEDNNEEIQELNNSTPCTYSNQKEHQYKSDLDKTYNTFGSKVDDNISTYARSLKAVLRKRVDTNPDGSKRIKQIKMLVVRINYKVFNIVGLGIEIVSDPLIADVVLTNSLERNYVFFIALMRGIPFITQKWLQKAVFQQSIELPYDNFYVVDTNFERQYKFNLTKSLKLAQTKKLFHGYTFMMTVNVKMKPKDLKSIICCGGGKVLTESTSTKDISKLFLVSEYEDKPQWKKYEQAYYNIVIIHSEGILSSVIQQSIQFHKHLLK